VGLLKLHHLLMFKKRMEMYEHYMMWWCNLFKSYDEIFLGCDIWNTV